MTARPPRAATRGEGRRAKTRGGTQSERGEARRTAPRRAQSSIVPTDEVVKIDLDQDGDGVDVDVDVDVLEETELAAPRAVAPLRMIVLEAGPHLAAAQTAIVAAGHTIIATGRDGADRLRAEAGDVDVVLVGLPGGEALIEAVIAQGAPRPFVIAACTSGAVDAARRAIAAGADLATVRPHHVERLAPILLAAARLVDQRHQLAVLAARAVAARPAAGEGAGGAGEPGELTSEPGELTGELIDELAEAEHGTLQSWSVFAQAAELELERARRYGYPLSLAVFRVDVPRSPPPPPGVPGILRARAGNALVHAIRDIDVATELDGERFAVLLPHSDRITAAEVARKIIGAVASADPVTLGSRTLLPRVIGAVVLARPADAEAFSNLLEEATQLLEQAQVTGASLAVET